MNDPMKIQHGGTHYKGLAIEPFELSLANHYDGAVHSIIKYLTRHGSKGGKEDLLKAHHITLIRAVQIKKHGPIPACRSEVGIEAYITLNRIEAPEAQIIRNAHLWAEGRLERLGDAYVTETICSQIGNLIALRYPEEETT